MNEKVKPIIQRMIAARVVKQTSDELAKANDRPHQSCGCTKPHRSAEIC